MRLQRKNKLSKLSWLIGSRKGVLALSAWDRMKFLTVSVTPLQAELWPLPRINRKLKMGSLPLTLTM
jgi:hypothetical protein